MQMSGSGSGIEKFMEQMEQMSEAQQGINKGTSQLPQLGMMAQQQMMQQLQQQQQQLKNQLEELLKENPSQESGGLSKVNEDMEDVIEDFRKKQVNRYDLKRSDLSAPGREEVELGRSRRDLLKSFVILSSASVWTQVAANFAKNKE